MRYSTCFCAQSGGEKVKLQRKQLVCSPHQNNFPQRNRSVISHGISTFLMILFDYDKLLNAVIYFHPPVSLYILTTVDLHIYTSDKHFVRSQFILIAPLCQRLLMIFYCSLHSVPHFTTVSLFPTARTLEQLRY